MPKYDFNKSCFATLLKSQHGCSPVNLRHIFRTPFLKNTSEGLLLYYNSTTIIKLESSSNSVVPSAFDCQGIDGFVTIIIICLRRWTSKYSQLELLWKVSKNSFEIGQWGSIFLVKLRIYNLTLSKKQTLACVKFLRTASL